MYKLIVTGCPRSGTAFMARLLTEGGISCNHEFFYGMPGISIVRNKAIAEASWLAVPYLERDKKAWDAKVIHIIRNPLKQISSLAHMHCLEDYNFEANPYTFFKGLHLPRLKRHGLLDRYIYFWIKWNLWAEKYADLTYRLEDIVKDPQEVFDDLGYDTTGKKFDLSKENNYTDVKQLALEDFKGCVYYDELIAEAKRYNYDLTSE